MWGVIIAACLALAASSVAADYSGEGETPDPVCRPVCAGHCIFVAHRRGIFLASPVSWPYLCDAWLTVQRLTTAPITAPAGTYYGDNGWEGEPSDTCLRIFALRAGKNAFCACAPCRTHLCG